MVLRWCAALAALALALPATALTGADEGDSGVIAGRVTLLGDEPVRERPNVVGLGVDDSRVRPPRVAVVFLRNPPLREQEEPTPRKQVLDQRDETFVPHTLPIEAGTEVAFPNSDDLYHNVFSLSKARRFDLGRYPQGESKSVRFDSPGVVRLFCEIHSHMSAFILVMDHGYFTTTDGDGGYRLDGVPDGSYELALWVDGEVRAAVPVVVRADETTEQDFQVELR